MDQGFSVGRKDGASGSRGGEANGVDVAKETPDEKETALLTRWSPSGR